MGFGSLINSGAQNNLASLQENTNLLGATMQQNAANQQATALQQEATNVFTATAAQASQEQVAGVQAAGKQAEGYASAGVEQTGSAWGMIQQTKLITSQQVAMTLAQGQLEQNSLLTQADIAQQTGLSEYLGALGQNQLTDQQNSLAQAQQKDQLEEQLFSGLFGFAGGAFDSALPTILSKVFPAPTPAAPGSQ